MPSSPTSPSRRRRPTPRHLLEYGGYRLALAILKVVPEALALWVGEGLGWMAGVVFRVRWRTVTDHLRQAFPEKGEEWRRATARASFRHLGREAVATFRLGRMEAGRLRERVEVEGFPVLQAAMRDGKGLIAVTGHFGNWEIGGASVAIQGIPLDVVAQRQRNPLFDADVNANRERLGMRVIERRDAPKQVLRALRSGRAVGIVADQNLRRGGVFVDFFGRPASTARGAALFAVRTGAPLVLGTAKRLPGRPHRYRVQYERVDIQPSGNLEQDVRRLTQAHTRLLEEKIREAPEQYFWQHRRWKTRPRENREGPGVVD